METMSGHLQAAYVARQRLNSRPKSIRPSTFVGPTISLQPIVRDSLAADPPVVIEPDRSEQEVPMLTRLAHLTIRHRWAMIGAWLALTLFGVFAAQKVSTR
jgi:predicted RND superfamily exporter protein